MRTLFALALFLCAGCATSGNDMADAWFGDIRSLFSSRDKNASGPLPNSAALGYSTSTPPITANAPAPVNP